MVWRGIAPVCLLLVVGCCNSPTPRNAENITPPPVGNEPRPELVDVPGSADPLSAEELPAASELLDLGSRMQVRALGAPLVKRGVTTSFELPNGESGWVTALPETGLGVTPAFGHGKVFVGGGFASRTMYAMDARTGRISWRVAAPDGGPSAAIVVDDKVLFNTESCTIFAVEIETGRMVWRRWLGDPLMSQPTAGDGRVFSAHPSGTSGTGYAMTALALSDGSVLWTVPVPADVVSAAVLAGDSLYFTTMDGIVHRRAQSDGREIWRREVGATTAPWVDGDRVLLARRVTAPAGQEGPYEEQIVISASDGAVIRGGEPVAAPHLAGSGRARKILVGQAGAWGSARRGREHLGFRNIAEGWAYQGVRPTVIDGRSYQVEGAHIQCRDVETGRLLWSRRYAADGGALAVSPPAVVGAQMVVATVDGHVYGLDIDTGMTVWAYNAGEPVVFQPSVALGWVYLATATGRLMAFPVGDESLDGWHMWGGNPSHEGPLPPAPPAADDEGDTDEDEGPGQGMMRVIVADERRIEELPLERTVVDARISGFVASVTVRQVFRNDHEEPLEAAYHFPLPANAAVDAMTVVAGERRIRGRIERREEARIIYRRARDAGLLAALLEQQRPNLFTQRLANIPAGESIDVEIHYVQMLPYDAGTYEFVFPMVAGARAQDPTASGEEEIEQHRPGTRPRDVTVSVTIEAGVPIENLDSPSHDIEIVRSGAGRATVRLAQEARIPNRDLLLRYDVAGALPRAALLSHHDQRGGFFTLLMQPAGSEGEVPDTRRRVTLALDTSSSLYGPALAQTKAVATTVLESLDHHESFQVVAFSDSVRTFTQSPSRATDANVTRAEEFVDDLRALGTTAMTAGLQTALRQESPPEDVLDIVVLVTDGYIASEREILRLVHDNLGHRRLFVVGVGPAPNRFLLERLAEVGRGALLIVSPADEPEVVAQDFIERIAHPQVTDLQIDWGELNVTSVYPRRVPDLFAGQPLMVHGRFDEAGEGEVVLRGRVGGRAWSDTLHVAFAEDGENNDAIASVWARSAIHDNMNRLMLRDDEDAEDRVTRLGLAFGLVTRFTSFIAVDDAALAAVEDDAPARNGSASAAGDSSDEPVATAATVNVPVPESVAAAEPASPIMAPPAASPMPTPLLPPTKAMSGGLDQLLESAVGGGGSPAGLAKASTPGRMARTPRGKRPSSVNHVPLSPAAVQGVITRHMGEIRTVAQRHRNGGATGGQMVVRLVIGANGHVVTATLASSAVTDAAFQRDVLAIFRRMAFPAFSGPNQTIAVPIEV